MDDRVNAVVKLLRSTAGYENLPYHNTRYLEAADEMARLAQSEEQLKAYCSFYDDLIRKHQELSTHLLDAAKATLSQAPVSEEIASAPTALERSVQGAAKDPTAEGLACTEDTDASLILATSVIKSASVPGKGTKAEGIIEVGGTRVTIRAEGICLSVQ